jgi:hypothetical protein
VIMRYRCASLFAYRALWLRAVLDFHPATLFSSSPFRVPHSKWSFARMFDHVHALDTLLTSYASRVPPSGLSPTFFFWGGDQADYGFTGPGRSRFGLRPDAT